MLLRVLSVQVVLNDSSSSSFIINVKDSNNTPLLLVNCRRRDFTSTLNVLMVNYFYYEEIGYVSSSSSLLYLAF